MPLFRRLFSLGNILGLFFFYYCGDALVGSFRSKELGRKREELLAEIGAFSYKVDAAVRTENWDDVLHDLRNIKGHGMQSIALETALCRAAFEGQLSAVQKIINAFPVRSYACLQEASRQAEVNGHANVVSFLNSRLQQLK